MKKIILSMLLISVIIPSVAFASWWNPFTWFKPNKKDIKQEVVIVATPTSQKNSSSTDIKNTTTLSFQDKVKPVVSTFTKLTNSQIIKKVKPATVYIETTDGSGSGMIISSDGYILTNAHVVKGFTSANVTISTGIKFPGVVVGRDESIDIAVIKLTSDQFFTKVELGNSDKLEQGDNVFAIGFPFGLKGDVSFTNGVISRFFDDYVAHSAEIHPGNSGGPLVNEYGQVVGINTASYTDQVIEGIQLGETIKLAIPVNVAKDLITSLKDGRSVIVESKKEKDDKARAIKETSCKESSVIFYNEYVKKANEIYSTNNSDYQFLMAKIDKYEELIRQDRDSQLSNIRSEYASLISNMEKTNASRAAAYSTLGMRGGTTEFAGGIQGGIEGEELNQANARIALLKNQEQSAIDSVNYNYQNAFQKYEDMRNKNNSDLEKNRRIVVGEADQEKEKFYQECLVK